METKLHQSIEARLSGMEAGLSRLLGQYWFGLENKEFFRTTACGLAAEVIKQQFDTLGYDSQLLRGSLAHPAYLRNRQTSDDHVICLVTIGQDSLVVDANYSQFFAPFGLDAYLARYQSEDPFPSNRSLMFRAGEHMEVAEWCTEVVQDFWRRNLYSLAFQDRHGYRVDSHNEFDQMIQYYNRESPPIRQLPRADLVGYFANIWDIDNYVPYASPQAVTDWLEEYYQSVDNRGVYL